MIPKENPRKVSPYMIPKENKRQNSLDGVFALSFY